MSTPRPQSSMALRVLRRSRTVPHPSITAMSGSASPLLNARCRSLGRCPAVVSALAAVGVFATVLASYPVYGQPPQRGPRSNTPVSTEVESAHTQAVNTAEAPPRASTEASAQASAAAPTGERRAPEHRVAPPSNPEPNPAEPVRVAMRTAAPAPTTTGADAPDPAPTEAADPAEPAAGRDPRRPPGKRTVIQDEFLVEGKLEKPSAYYILRRSSLDYDWARLDAKFSPLVLESVQDPLF
jgi:hypothetical protein